jgi:ATP-dependent RNA helicase DeaD
MEPAVAAGLERLGWRADAPEVRDTVPAVLRGSNVVAVLPPTPEWSAPILAALLGQPPAADRALLILAAPGQLGEWAVTVGALVEGTGLQVDIARESGDSGTVHAAIASDVVIASPEGALARHSRSALQPDRFRTVLFAWPEAWHADDAVTALLQDLPKDAQRVVLTARRDQLDGADSVVERYARKALVAGGAPTEATPTPKHALSVRTVATPWATRAATVAAVMDSLNPPRATIWTADQRDHQLIHRALGSLRPGLVLAARSRPDAGTIICYDLPAAQELVQLSAVGEVVLLVPPGCEEFVARIAPSRRPMALNSPVNAALDRDASLRQGISAAIERGDQAGALYALAPLFERYDAQVVAAALFGLWQSRAAAAPTSAAPRVAVLEPARAEAVTPSERGARVEGVAKIWIGAGKKDDATVADFVAVLVREVGVERSRIGRIELRDTFALVEVPAADAEAIVLRLSGITIRKRKLTARVDQRRAGGAKAPTRPR